MSILETILVFVAIPLAIYAFFALVTLRSKFASKPRYRPGQAWDHEPIWWSANPQGAPAKADDSERDQPALPGVRGGASGNW